MTKANPYSGPLSSPDFVDALVIRFGSLKAAAAKTGIPKSTLSDMRRGHVGAKSSVKATKYYATLKGTEKKSIDALRNLSSKLSPRQQKALKKMVQGKHGKQLLQAIRGTVRKKGYIPAQVMARARAISAGRALGKRYKLYK